MTTIDVRWLAALAITVIMGGAHAAQAEDAAALATLLGQSTARGATAGDVGRPGNFGVTGLPSLPKIGRELQARKPCSAARARKFRHSGSVSTSAIATARRW